MCAEGEFPSPVPWGFCKRSQREGIEKRPAEAAAARPSWGCPRRSAFFLFAISRSPRPRFSRAAENRSAAGAGLPRRLHRLWRAGRQLGKINKNKLKKKETPKGERMAKPQRRGARGQPRGEQRVPPGTGHHGQGAAAPPGRSRVPLRKPRFKPKTRQNLVLSQGSEPGRLPEPAGARAAAAGTSAPRGDRATGGTALAPGSEPRARPSPGAGRAAGGQEKTRSLSPSHPRLPAAHPAARQDEHPAAATRFLQFAPV